MNNEQQTPAPVQTRSSRKAYGITAAALIALLAAAGTAYAASSANADNSTQPAAASPVATQQAAGHDDDDDNDNDHDDRKHTGTLADASIDALRTAAQAALTHANAQSVSSIEVERGGYEVEVLFANHDEQELFVAADGAIKASAVEKADADDDAEPALDLSQLDTVVTAAQDAAQGKGAQGKELSLESISASDDAPEAYEVEFRSGTGDDVEVNLDAALKPVDIDD